MTDTPEDQTRAETTAFRRQVLSGFGWQGATKAVVQTFSWVSTVVVARLLAPSDYGTVAVSEVFIAALAMFVELGLTYGLIQKPRTTVQEEDGVFYFNVAVSLAAYGLLFAVAPLVAGFYDNPVLSAVLRVAGIGLVLGSIKAVPLAIAMRRMDFRYRSLAEMGAMFIGSVTVITMAFQGFGLWSLIAGFLASQFAGAAAFLPAFRRLPRPHLSLKLIRDVLSYGLKITGTSTLAFIYSRADVTIIGKVLGERILGYYSMAFQLATIPLDKIATIFNQVTFPSMSRIQDNPEESRKLFLELHRHLLIITYPVLLGLALVADDLVLLLLTEKWLPIVPVLQGLCAVNLLRVSGTTLPPVLNGRGKAGVVLRYAAISAVVLPAAFLVGAHYGLTGVVAAWAVAYPPLYLLLLLNCLRDLGIPFGAFLRLTVSAAVSCAIMVGVVLGVKVLGHDLNPWVRLGMEVGSGAGAYVGSFLLLFRDQIDQIRKGFAMLRKRPA